MPNNDQLPILLEKLNTEINLYLQDIDRIPNKISFQDGTVFRPHYFAGETGRQRALAYQNKINGCLDLETLVKMIVNDCDQAFKLANQETLFKKSVDVTMGVLQYAMNQIGFFGNKEEIEKKASDSENKSANLGNSEMLRNNLVVILYFHFNLSLQDAEFINKLKLSNPIQADLYTGNIPLREFIAIQEYVRLTWPENDAEHDVGQHAI